MAENNGQMAADASHQPVSSNAPETNASPAPDTSMSDTPMSGSETPYDHQQETAKAIRFMVIKAAVFILIPVIASVLAILILL
ncbi:phosphoribosylformylglycinamidine synthase-associated small membrane protein [uncultured Cohaesibacter sp.]|uniref:phosphoribosylformylglycinamidine synthase-associated small membrane protein n=1 Tax=uncultured Cohaesibacter sp. TaxID=1002546 RepID=UPI0029C73AA9|nr:phosphoribosylformylglycinamidine synthase-associated small membrane protein [uncultured Cohaesibacter sp.]